MQLSDELFAEIRDALDAQGIPQPRPDDRRSKLRLSADLDITIEPYGVVQGQPRTARLKNLSTTGVSFLDGRAARTGEKLIAHLPRKTGAVPLICTVRNSRLRKDGLFSIGAQFTSHAEVNHRPVMRGVEGVTTRDADLELLHGRAQAGEVQPSGDKRRRRRIDKTAALTIIPYADGRCGQQVRSEMRDLSPTGLCVIQKHRMDRGQEFLVKPVGENGPLWKLYAVVSCRTLDGGRFRIGARYKRDMRCADAPRGMASRMRSWLRSA